jgi:MraZ protein
LDDDGNPPLVMVFHKGALWAWTLEVFERTIEGPLAQADAFDDDVMAFSHSLLSSASDVVMDGQGRIRLPAHLRRQAGIDRDVVVHSIVDRIEIWDRTAWQRRYEEALHKSRGMSGLPGKRG